MDPHISVAYSHGDRDAGPVIDALALRPGPAPLRVEQVHLVAQERVGHLYRWEAQAVARLGG